MENKVNRSELIQHIEKIHSLPEKLLSDFIHIWRHKSAKKGQIVFSAGSRVTELQFTVEGIQKAYYTADEKCYNIAFTYPYSFTCVPESFITGTPSQYTFECISDSTFLVISRKDFFYFVDHFPPFETLLRKTLVGTLNGVTNRYHRILTLSIEERFRDFMKTSPQLINQINHKEIANYLKIDPTNFSKLLNTVKV